MTNNRINTREELENKEIVTVDELLNSNIPQSKWLVENIIPEKGMSILAGRWGNFKSYLAMWMACCCIKKIDFLNLKTESIKVLYIDEENDDIELKRRFEMISNTLQLTKKEKQDIGLTILKDVIINSIEGKRKMEEWIINFKPKLVIIDCFTRVFRGDENTSKDTKMVFQMLKPLTKKYNISFLILDHVRKTSDNKLIMDDIRGSGDKAGQCSSVLILNREGNDNTFILEQGKVRGRPQKIKPIKFTVHDINIEDKIGIKIKYEGETEVPKTDVERGADKIKEWLVNQTFIEFKTKAVKDEFENILSKDTIWKAMKKLESMGIIICLNRKGGKWKKVQTN